MSETYDVIVIGAGAAGFMCAIEAGIISSTGLKTTRSPITRKPSANFFAMIAPQI